MSDARSVLGGGDVKYHMGATGEYVTRGWAATFIFISSPIRAVQRRGSGRLGRVRAKQERAGPGGSVQILPLLVHGDGAFAGQGVLAETLNYAEIPGYSVGGTVHVIVNNLIGFTTVSSELHSARFAAQLARRQSIPIFHVNAEDVDAVLRVGRMALDYRYTFASDVVIDLIGYRRHGHSEVDDPTITQPRLYKAIKDHPPLWEIYAEDVDIDDAQPRADVIKAELEAAQSLAGSVRKKPTLRELPHYWDSFFGGRYKPQYDVPTVVSADELLQLTERLTTYPADFHIHPKVKKLLEQRAEMGAGNARWITAWPKLLPSPVWSKTGLLSG